MSLLEAQREQTRARYPDDEGYVEREGVRVFYEVYGDGEPTVFLLPTWSIVHSRYWKMQIPYLARHFRVLTFDGRGNGKADRPSGIARLHRMGVRRGLAGRHGRDRDGDGRGRRLLLRRVVGHGPRRGSSGPGPGRRVHRPLRAARAGASGAERPLLRGPPRHRGGLGEVQPPLLARALRGVPRVLLREDVQRAPFDQADRGLRRLGPRDRARDAHRGPRGARALRHRALPGRLRPGSLPSARCSTATRTRSTRSPGAPRSPRPPAAASSRSKARATARTSATR